MTHLQRYIETAGMSQAELARLLGISRGYMSEITSGKKTPSLRVASDLERLTAGAVAAASWCQKNSEGA